MKRAKITGIFGEGGRPAVKQEGLYFTDVGGCWCKWGEEFCALLHSKSHSLRRNNYDALDVT